MEGFLSLPRGTDRLATTTESTWLAVSGRPTVTVKVSWKAPSAVVTMKSETPMDNGAMSPFCSEATEGSPEIREYLRLVASGGCQVKTGGTGSAPVHRLIGTETMPWTGTAWAATNTLKSAVLPLPSNTNTYTLVLAAALGTCWGLSRMVPTL